MLLFKSKEMLNPLYSTVWLAGSTGVLTNYLPKAYPSPLIKFTFNYYRIKTC